MDTNSKDGKGFAGLVDLVSDLSDLSPLGENNKSVEEPNRSHAQAKENAVSAIREGGQNRAQGSSPTWTSSEASSGMPIDTKFVLWALAVIVLVILYAMSQNGSTGQSSSSFSVQGESNSEYSESTDGKSAGGNLSDLSLTDLDSDEKPQNKTSPQNSTVSSRYDETQPEYEKPSKGTSNILSIPQIRWCIKSGMRIEAMRGIFISNSGIDRFNEIVADYNSRCGSYRYRQGNLALAQRQVEEWRGAIESEARAEATRIKQNLSSTSTGASTNNAPMKPNAQHTREAQQLLTDLGYDPGPVDGDFGPRTANAVKAFQRAQGQVVDGWVSERLIDSLKSAIKKKAQKT